MSSFWNTISRFAQNASRALPPCHVCGAPGAQVCCVCNRVGCHRHAYTNFGAVRSVCSVCMAEKFPWASEDLRQPVDEEDWPYNEQPWEILGVAPNASADEINKAHREVSRLFHPDKQNGDADRQVAINKAREEMLRRAA